MDISWLKNDRVIQIFVDGKSLMRAVRYSSVTGRRTMVLFPPPCIPIAGEGITIRPFNEFAFEATDIMSPQQLRREILTLGYEILTERISFLEVVRSRTTQSENDRIVVFAVTNFRDSEETNPVLPYTDINESLLERMRYLRKCSMFLKFFVLYVYSTHDQVQFQLVEGEDGGEYVYDVTTRDISNPTFVSDDKTTVYISNSNLQEPLEKFLDLSIKNSKAVVDTFKTKTNVDFFTHLSDFETNGTGEILFSTLSDLGDWKTKRLENDSVVLTELPPTFSLNTFFFKHELVAEGKVCILQPVRTLVSAIWVCKSWTDRKINVATHTPRINASDYMQHVRILDATLNDITRQPTSGDFIVIKIADDKFYAVLPQHFLL
jgi:hypothetical protein